jgi:hypothetical protein
MLLVILVAQLALRCFAATGAPKALSIPPDQYWYELWPEARSPTNRALGMAMMARGAPLECRLDPLPKACDCFLPPERGQSGSCIPKAA